MREKKMVRAYLDGRRQIRKDESVALDRMINIFVNGDYLITLVATPEDKGELAVGHLLGQGIIEELGDVEEIEIEKNDIRVNVRGNVQFDSPKSLKTVPTACGISGDIQKLLKKGHVPELKSDGKFKSTVISKAVRSLHAQSEIYRETGGVHAAAIFSEEGEQIFLMEDVGRHNAVDKAIGRGLLEGIDFGGCFLASSGRLSGDMVLKCAMAGIPLVASKSAPLMSGIAAAKMCRMSLIGFVRGNRLNIYTRPERVEIK